MNANEYQLEYHLKRCPWCNDHHLTMDIQNEVHSIRCLECGCVGPASNDSPVEAVEMWNGTQEHQNPSALVQNIGPDSNRNDLKWVRL